MEKRTRILTVRLTEREYRAAKKKAERVGWSLSLYTRMTLLFPPMEIHNPPRLTHATERKT